MKINVSDAIQIEKYERALEELNKSEQPNGKASEVLKAQCDIVRRFFDTCFGEGSASKLFGDSYDYRAHYQALANLIQDANNDLEQFSKEMAQNASKYSANRTVR